MHKLRRARVCGQEFQINDFNVTNTRWINLAGGIDHDGTCTGGSFNNRFGNYANVVAYGQVSMLFSTGTALRLMQKDNIRLASGITCSLDSLDCIDPTYGYIFWNQMDIYPCSDDSYHVAFQDPATKVMTALGKTRDGEVKYSTMFSVKEPEQMFTLTTTGEKEVCRYHMYQTEHPQYLIVEVKENVYPFRKLDIPTNELDLFMYVNAKIIHVTRGIDRSLRSIYRALSTDICFTAVAAGEVIHIIKCIPVPVSPRRDDDYTVEHPVSYANQNYYLSPRSHILQKTATPTPCSDILTPEYKIAGKWYSFRKGMIPTREPIIVTPKRPSKWEGLDLGNIMDAGIYTSEQIERVRHQIMYSQERRAISEKITGALNGDSVSHNRLNYGIFIDKEELKSQFTQWWMETWGIFKTFENNIVITQKYLEKGHTQMECDSVHSAIECKLKVKESYLSQQYMAITKTARSDTMPYEARYLDYTLFIDFSKELIHKSIRPGKKTADPVVTDVRLLEYRPNGTIWYKIGFDDELQPLPYRPTPINRIKQMNHLPKLYAARILITKRKYEDLQDLKRVLPSSCQYFYDDLPHSNR
ncbi:unnamed protein product [Arctia plantaginis]|uniref:Uncharacterized protein n=1 Tax=Arctia plantaginis TaxID=874455 RepID=A0A8S1AY12_ARCPL|nr:unnamed protein product [Arctia plantaginis]